MQDSTSTLDPLAVGKQTFADALVEVSNTVRHLEREVRAVRQEASALRQQLLAAGIAPCVPETPRTAPPSERPQLQQPQQPQMAYVPGYYVPLTPGGALASPATPGGALAYAPTPGGYVLASPGGPGMLFPSPAPASRPTSPLQPQPQPQPQPPPTPEPRPDPELAAFRALWTAYVGRKVVLDRSRGEKPGEIRFLGAPIVLESSLPPNARVLLPETPVGRDQDMKRVNLICDDNRVCRDLLYG